MEPMGMKAVTRPPTKPRLDAAALRSGIRNFKPTLRQAAERLTTMHTPEGTPVPPNALAELQRDVARLGFVGAKRREQGLAKAGNARVRRGMIQLAWRFLRFQKTAHWPSGTRNRPFMGL
jgi:hypothetical protein